MSTPSTANIFVHDIANLFIIHQLISFIVPFNRFDIHHPCFFTSAIRSRIVLFILERKRYLLGDEDDYAFGIDRLINEGVYLAAYPLHDVSEFNTEENSIFVHIPYHHGVYLTYINLDLFLTGRIIDQRKQSTFIVYEVGERFKLVSFSTIRLHQGLFWCKNRTLFRLVGILHIYATVGISRRIWVLLVCYFYA